MNGKTCTAIVIFLGKNAHVVTNSFGARFFGRPNAEHTQNVYQRSAEENERRTTFFVSKYELVRTAETVWHTFFCALDRLAIRSILFRSIFFSLGIATGFSVYFGVRGPCTFFRGLFYYRCSCCCCCHSTTTFPSNEPCSFGLCLLAPLQDDVFALSSNCFNPVFLFFEFPPLSFVLGSFVFSTIFCAAPLLFSNASKIVSKCRFPIRSWFIYFAALNCVCAVLSPATR